MATPPPAPGPEPAAHQPVPAAAPAPRPLLGATPTEPGSTWDPALPSATNFPEPAHDADATGTPPAGAGLAGAGLASTELASTELAGVGLAGAEPIDAEVPDPGATRSDRAGREAAGAPRARARREPLIGKERGTVMRDVAKLAGVSHQTVSRVINEHPNVRAETRERVLAAMRSLNYRRNLAARTLATRQSHTLGIIGFETTLFGPESMLYGIESAARAAGYLVSVATVRDLEHRPVLEAVDRLAQHDVDGIIAIAPKPSVTTALTHAPAGLACVAVGGSGRSGQPGGGPFPTVRVDNTEGARLATRYLLELGHPTVHHVGGPPDWPEAQARVDGWRETLYAAGAVVPPVTVGWWDAAAGYEQGRQLATDPSVTAVFCANDRIALGVLRALHESGRRVPDDVSVVGFDDMPDSGYFMPPLTTVRQDFAELGRRALALLLRHMGRAAGDDPPEDVVVAPSLVPRSSGVAPHSRR